MTRIFLAWRNLLIVMILVFTAFAGVTGCTPHSKIATPGKSQQDVDADLLTVNGRDLFTAHCASCHGAEGEGATPSVELSPQSVPDLRHIGTRNGGRFPAGKVREIIDGRQMIEAHHRQMMPRWGDELQRLEGDTDDARRRVDQKIDALVNYVQSIQIKE